jgi:hypothetical protein
MPWQYGRNAVYYRMSWAIQAICRGTVAVGSWGIEIRRGARLEAGKRVNVVNSRGRRSRG